MVQLRTPAFVYTGFFLFCAFVVLHGSPTQSAIAQEKSELLRIAATVYNELIFLNDVDRALLQSNPGRNFDSLQKDELFTIRMRMLGLLIDERLQVRAIERLMTPTMRRDAERDVNLEVSERMSNLREELESRNQLQQWQMQQGMTLEQYERIQYRMTYRNYLRTILAQRIKQNEVTPPTEAELEAYRQENPDYETREEIRIAQIQINVPEGTTAAEEASILLRANEAAQRARTGEPFGTLVREFSEHAPSRERNGILPRTKRGELFSEFDVLFDMEPGTITDPIKTRVGYHVVLVLENENLPEMVMREKLQQVMQDWTVELRDQASEHINIRLTPDGVETPS